MTDDQRPAVCLPGREIGQDPSTAKYSLNKAVSEGMQVMMCMVPTAVYPCFDTDIDPSVWKGDCRNIAPARLPKWLTQKVIMNCENSECREECKAIATGEVRPCYYKPPGNTLEFEHKPFTSERMG